ncbi:MAG: type II secretion system ATPase GspE [Pseudomonadota bacterium]
MIEASPGKAELPYSFAKRHRVLLQWNDATEQSQIVYEQGCDWHAVIEAQRFAGRLSSLKPLDSDSFEAQLNRCYQSAGDNSQELANDLGEIVDLDSMAEAVNVTEDLMEQEDEAPIIKLLNSIFSQAIQQQASDIHVETFENQMAVRFRIDGVLQPILELKRALAPLLVSRIKVMAKLDIAEKRVPQDGRIALRIAGRDIDVRVSTMPASDGERIVMRLLDQQVGRLDFAALGMSESNRGKLDTLLHRPHGIFLVTGPTGSGKTTTLYAGLSQIHTGQKNILTIEDPIEYNLPGIGQTQVNSKTDMTFARGLRAMLRQDPDVVMVGEIRDVETAQIAIQASLTGHLVLSTLHTNTAIGAITRLVDMGVEPFLLSSSLMGVLAQRLVRRLCEHCREPHAADASECEKLGLPDNEAPIIYRAKGCPHCNHLGYKGRTGIYELVVIDDTLREQIHNRACEAELVQHAFGGNGADANKDSQQIYADGCQQVLNGITTLEEVLRVTQEA